MYLPNFLDGFDRLVAFDTEMTGNRSYGNVVLSCGAGNLVDLRGLPGGAEGIPRTGWDCGHFSHPGNPLGLPGLRGGGRSPSKPVSVAGVPC